MTPDGKLTLPVCDTIDCPNCGPGSPSRAIEWETRATARGLAKRTTKAMCKACGSVVAINRSMPMGDPRPDDVAESVAYDLWRDSLESNPRPTIPVPEGEHFHAGFRAGLDYARRTPGPATAAIRPFIAAAADDLIFHRELRAKFKAFLAEWDAHGNAPTEAGAGEDRCE